MNADCVNAALKQIDTIKGFELAIQPRQVGFGEALLFAGAVWALTALYYYFTTPAKKGPLIIPEPKAAIESAKSLSTATTMAYDVGNGKPIELTRAGDQLVSPATETVTPEVPSLELDSEGIMLDMPQSFAQALSDGDILPSQCLDIKTDDELILCANLWEKAVVRESSAEGKYPQIGYDIRDHFLNEVGTFLTGDIAFLVLALGSGTSFIDGLQVATAPMRGQQAVLDRANLDPYIFKAICFVLGWVLRWASIRDRQFLVKYLGSGTITIQGLKAESPHISPPPKRTWDDQRLSEISKKHDGTFSMLLKLFYLQDSPQSAPVLEWSLFLNWDADMSKYEPLHTSGVFFGWSAVPVDRGRMFVSWPAKASKDFEMMTLVFFDQNDEPNYWTMHTKIGADDEPPRFACGEPIDGGKHEYNVVVKKLECRFNTNPLAPDRRYLVHVVQQADGKTKKVKLSGTLYTNKYRDKLSSAEAVYGNNDGHHIDMLKWDNNKKVSSEPLRPELLHKPSRIVLR